MSLLEWRNTPDSNGLSPVHKLMSRRTRTTIPTTEALINPKVADGVNDNIKRKRQQAKAGHDKHAKPPPKLQLGEPITLQPPNLKAPWEKGSCVASVGPHSFLIETESGSLFRRNGKCSFVKILVRYQSYLRTPIAVQQTRLQLIWVHQIMAQSCESPQPRVTAAKDAETLLSRQTVTRSRRTSARPSRLKDFVAKR